MKPTIIAAFLCVFLSCVPIKIPKDALNVLYGIVGVLFSVGMSLIIAFTAKDIVNSELKKILRKSMHQIRNNFLWIFFISTLFYVVFSIVGENSQFSIHFFKTESYELTVTFSVSVAVLGILIYSTIALVSNYMDIQGFYEDIEDRIQNETNKSHNSRKIT